MASDPLLLHRIAPWFYPTSDYYPVRVDGRTVPRGWTELFNFPDRAPCPACGWGECHYGRGYETQPASLICMRCLYQWTPRLSSPAIAWETVEQREIHFTKRLIAQLDLASPSFMPIRAQGRPLVNDAPESLAPVARLATRALSRLEPLPDGPAVAPHIGEAIQVAYLDLAPELHPSGRLETPLTPAEEYVVSLVWMGVALCHDQVEELGGAAAQAEVVLVALKSATGQKW